MSCESRALTGSQNVVAAVFGRTPVMTLPERD